MDHATEKEQRLQFDSDDVLRLVAGERGGHLRLIERRGGIRVEQIRGGLRITGRAPDVELAADLLVQLGALVQRGYPLYPNDVDQAWSALSANRGANLSEIFLDTVYISSDKRTIAPKTTGQKVYIDAIRTHDVVFGVGPAGTGKTYLAMAMAVAALSQHQVKRIILARPAVEAGEKLGFLPGSLVEKVNPYLRPLYDALHDMMEPDKAQALVERGTVEVAPLAFMRGRTINNGFVVLDEAQNTTREQMKMFLTRLGFGSKAVITGDITQVDLPNIKRSGLMHATEVLRDVKGVAFCKLTDKDVVRHPLVAAIVRAYDKADQREAERRAAEAAQRGEDEDDDRDEGRAETG